MLKDLTISRGRKPITSSSCHELATEATTVWAFSPFSESGREKSGIYFTAHGMIRAYARNLYDIGYKPEAIQKVLGHEKLETTLKYIGLDQDIIKETMIGGDRYANMEVIEEDSNELLLQS